MRRFSFGDKQLVDDVEPLLALGIVGARNVDERDELAAGSSRRNCEHVEDAARLDGQRQFAESEARVQHRAGQRGCDFLADGLQQLVHSMRLSLQRRLYRSIVPVRRIFFCSIRTP